MLTGFTALAGFLVISLVQVASQEISVISNSMQDVLDDFAQRKAYLDRSLFAIGAIIGVGILATGILRDLSLEHIDAVTTENYPKSFVVAYGAYYACPGFRSGSSRTDQQRAADSYRMGAPGLNRRT